MSEYGHRMIRMTIALYSCDAYPRSVTLSAYRSVVLKNNRALVAPQPFSPRVHAPRFLPALPREGPPAGCGRRQSARLRRSAVLDAAHENCTAEVFNPVPTTYQYNPWHVLGSGYGRMAERRT